ncbi:MAG: tRNA (guanosine(37)-N1)-methyltransferase TrmD [Cellvibrio sp.]|nr:tRNA (guanosine(37)-N1)-methyltransferase TrmD [Cellvibrio sp.]
MKIALVTLFPEMLKAVTEFGISGRAVRQGLLELATWSPRDFAHDKHKTVDDRPYGGGPGMLMMVQPLRDAINAAKDWANTEETLAKVIYLSPQGKVFNQQAAVSMANDTNLVLVAGRYEGIDERLIQALIDEEWSIGDYVLSGGELAAMVIVDAITRLQPGALGHEQSAEQDSFTEGLLDCPHYTRPEDFDGMRVPDVLLSGNHAQIRRWRLKQSLGRTWQRRPDLLHAIKLTEEQQALLTEFRRDLENDKH